MYTPPQPKVAKTPTSSTATNDSPQNEKDSEAEEEDALLTPKELAWVTPDIPFPQSLENPARRKCGAPVEDILDLFKQLKN